MIDTMRVADVEELAKMIPDGAKIAVLKNQTGVPAELFSSNCAQQNKKTAYRRCADNWVRHRYFDRVRRR